jgi:hypothetical protein
MHPTQVIRLSQAEDKGVGNRLLSGSSVLLVAGVVLAAIVFFSKNPFRVGEITVTTPNGPSVTVKVANSNEISELIHKGLENETTAGYVTNSLLNIIENLPAGSKLGEKLMELAEQRKRPFSSNSVPVRLVYDPNVPNGLAAVCEKSDFSAKNIVVFVLGKNGELLHQTVAFADASMTFPCPGDGETVRLNYKEILELNSDQVMVKRNL